MMSKSNFLFFSFFLLIPICLLSQDYNKKGKIKTYKTERYIVKYPKKWKRFAWHGAINFAPKSNEINKLNSNISIYHYKQEVIIGNSLLDVINKNISATESAFSDVTYKIQKNASEYGDMFSVELSRTINQTTYRSISYYYFFKKDIYVIKYSFKDNLYHTYLDDAKFILSSFKFND